MFKRVLNDFIHTCQLSQTPSLSQTCYKALSAYRNYVFDNQFDYEFRITTKPIPFREVSFRSLDIEANVTSTDTYNPYQIAKDNQLIVTSNTSNDEPIINKAYQDVYNALSDYKISYGLDIGAVDGLEKIWLFFAIPAPISILMNTNKVKHFPNSIHKYASYFEKYDINTIECIGFDFTNSTINIYHFFPSFIKDNNNMLNNMSKDLQFTQCSVFDDLPLNALLSLNFTFDFKDENIIRFCPYWKGNNSIIPKEFYGQLPIDTLPFYDIGQKEEDKKYISGICVGSNFDNYYGKLEWDYHAKRVEMLDQLQFDNVL
eukprot:276755_1